MQIEKWGDILYIKKVKFSNSLGELVFDNHLLYCESIDTTGNSVRFISEQLMGTHGNTTLSAWLNAKTVPCVCKFYDRNGNPAFRDYIIQVLNPLIVGELTVHGEYDTYTINCRPSEIPTFTRTDNKLIWAFNVDFIADYPFWRKGVLKNIPLQSANTVKHISTMPDTPVKIYFPANIGTPPFSINGNGFSFTSSPEVGVYVDTRNYTVTGTDGKDYGNLIGTDNIGKCVLQNGNNTIFCPTYQGVIVYYNELSLGVI